MHNLPLQARSQAEDFVFEWDESEEDGDNQTMNLFEERMAAQAAAEAASGEARLGGHSYCTDLLHCLLLYGGLWRCTGVTDSAPEDMPLTAQTADVLSAYSAEQGRLVQHVQQLLWSCDMHPLQERAITKRVGDATPGFKEITVQKLSELRGADGTGVALLDVRTPEEYGEQQPVSVSVLAH